MTKKKNSKVGVELQKYLDARSMLQADLAEQLEVSPAYVSSISTGTKKLSAKGVESFSKALNLSAEEEVGLHRAAACDQGFKLDLPDDF